MFYPLIFCGVFVQVWCGLTNTGEMIAVKQVELNHSNFDEAEEVRWLSENFSAE